MRVKDLIHILSILSEEEQEKEIQIDSYGDPVEIIGVKPDIWENDSYIITFEKCGT